MYQLGVTCWVTVASPGKTTPYLNPQPGAQLKYNIMLEHTKIHEMLWREELGEMKRRFHFIRFPLDNQQLHRIKANFMACRYAGVVGAVDGTHIQIIAPSKDEDVFVNRKNVHSINTQIVFDATFYILDVAKWPRVYP
ncbi:putative nuclease HARBI1 [Merluccius polli]|uniref:Nuclease HARBI1 n=1 Tax=Merluccius polli TaxID=89951 RepID=A0AA47MPT6_MERPO|nr:putative nuclease HARBI1 [Merluccius polli]